MSHQMLRSKTSSNLLRTKGGQTPRTVSSRSLLSKTPTRPRSGSELNLIESSTISLKQIVKTFSVEPFDAEAYIGRYFNSNTLDKATKTQKALQNWNNDISDRLKSIVCDNYEKVIDTSQEIKHVRDDMRKLSQKLSQYKKTIDNIKDTMSLDFDFDKNFGEYSDKLDRDRERDKMLRTIPRISGSKDRNPDNANQDIQLEELAEDLRTLIYQRMWEKAVEKVEIGRQKN